jgi:hypothetical protein
MCRSAVASVAAGSRSKALSAPNIYVRAGGISSRCRRRDVTVHGRDRRFSWLTDKLHTRGEWCRGEAGMQSKIPWFGVRRGQGFPECDGVCHL